MIGRHKPGIPAATADRATHRPRPMIDRFDVRARLREVIAALDRRVRHPARQAEAAIAADAASLKRQAEDRIAALDHDGPAAAQEDGAHG